MEKKVTIGNVCFIRDNKNNKVLLLKRAREPMQNMYTGVGGKTGFEEDIYASCLREAKEETGLAISDVKLKGIIKTVLDGKDSSWILFVYLADKFDGGQIPCNEGELEWVPIDELYSHNLIGFIRRTLPHVLDDHSFVEGTIRHDMAGKVIEERLNVTKSR